MKSKQATSGAGLGVDDRPIVLAAVAHPDDIEFCFAGTLLLLKEVGCDVHMWNLANGCCGATKLSRRETVRLRRAEAQKSASLAGATYHGPLFNDLEIFYEKRSLMAVNAVIRTIRPQIVLTHSPDDYMEDHQNVCRLIVSAVFARGMPNFVSRPRVPSFSDPVRIYHGAPHGLCDGLDHLFHPDFLVDIRSSMSLKRRMLNCHVSQGEWLGASQDMESFLDQMESMSEMMASLGHQLRHAEGWRRHSHLGFCPADFDPLVTLLGRLTQLVKQKNARQSCHVR